MCLTVFYCAILISNIKEQTVCNKSAVINRGDSYPLDQLRYFNFALIIKVSSQSSGVSLHA